MKNWQKVLGSAEGIPIEESMCSNYKTHQASLSRLFQNFIDVNK